MRTEEEIQRLVAAFREKLKGDQYLPASAQEYSAKVYEEGLRQPPMSKSEMEEQITRNRRLSRSGRKQREDRRGT